MPILTDYTFGFTYFELNPIGLILCCYRYFHDYITLSSVNHVTTVFCNSNLMATQVKTLCLALWKSVCSYPCIPILGSLSYTLPLAKVLELLTCGYVLLASYNTINFLEIQNSL